MKSIKNSTKKGITSIYVVVFTTILFGIITLSFVRLITSESSQTSNSDLSQSAYDSAMAGVEDAKIAVNQYYECLSSGSTSDSCAGRTNINDLFGGTCEDSKLQKFLYGSGVSGEMKIKEETSSETSLDQAYTCVILSNVVDDYRGTLTSDTPTKVIPIGIKGNADQSIDPTAQSNELGNVRKIRFEWHSENNSASDSGTLKKNTDNNGKLASKSDATTPPVISMRLVATGSTFNLSDFNTSATPANGQLDSTMILLPTDKGYSENSEQNERGNTIQWAEVQNAGNSNGQSGDGSETDRNVNTPFYIYCEDGRSFMCYADIYVNFQNDGNALMMVTMPYGDSITDFAVTLYDDHDSPIPFENVQISVDSTGRTNDLVRRVESRLDPADLYFPYLDNEVTLTGGGDTSLVKNFWITKNCWSSKSSGTSGSATTCRNNGDLN